MFEAGHLGSHTPNLPLRRAALQANAASHSELELGSVWRDLVSGRLTIVDHFESAQRLYLVLALPTRSARSGLSPRKLLPLESALAGGALKVAAIEFRRSESAMVLNAKSVFSYMGLACKLSRAPAVLIMAAHAAHWHEVGARSSEFEHAGRRLRVVSVQRPEDTVEALLSPAERAVLRLMIEGLSHAEIAGARGTSRRTIANQLGAVFRKLGASGRLGVIRRLLRDSPPPARPAVVRPSWQPSEAASF